MFPACFLGALQFVAGKAGNKAAANAKIHSSVTLGHSAELDGFALKVDLKVEGVEDEALIKAAHEVVPPWPAPAVSLTDLPLYLVLSVQPRSETWRRGKRQQGLKLEGPTLKFFYHRKNTRPRYLYNIRIDYQNLVDRGSDLVIYDRHPQSRRLVPPHPPSSPPTMHLYNLTLQPPTAITHAIVGNFSGARHQEIIVSRGTRLELLRVDMQTGKLSTVVSTEAFGTIRSLAGFRLTGGTKGELSLVRIGSLAP